MWGQKCSKTARNVSSNGENFPTIHKTHKVAGKPIFQHSRNDYSVT